MKRIVIITLLAVIAVGALAWLVAAGMKNRPRTMDERITLRQKHKNPYGFYVARQLLPAAFPAARIYSETEKPGESKFLDHSLSNQVVFYPCLRFYASEDELRDIRNFIANGNHVFIIARQLSYEAKNFLGLNASDVVYDDPLMDTGLSVKLKAPLVGAGKPFSYSGKRFSSSVEVDDSSRMLVLGTNAEGEPNFIQLRSGKGSLTLHTAPLAFSNYFLLQKNNLEYLENAFSAIPGEVETVVWSEYYFVKRDLPEGEPGWLAVLFRFESFRWAFLTAIALIALFVLLEMRRKQRVIPALARPKNESLDFVQTIGRLYYDKKDHRDLAMKMSSYFLNDVRSRFKIPTGSIDEEFVELLHMKSGYPADKLASLVDTMKALKESGWITETELYNYHKQLEEFYQTT